MKNRIFIAVVVLMIALCGCEEPEKPNRFFQTLSLEDSGRIVYDTRTGVEYWMSWDDYTYGTLTLLVDKNGNPLIVEGY